MPRLIGIAGKAGAGKDTLAAAFIEYAKYSQYSLAGPLKEACASLFGFSVDNYCSREYKEQVIPWCGQSPRTIAQYIGTDMVRKNFGEDFWIHRLLQEFMLDYESAWKVQAVVSDIRFQNEAEWVLLCGGTLVIVTRPQDECQSTGIPGHSSEADLDLDSLRQISRGKIIQLTNGGTLRDYMKQCKQLAIIRNNTTPLI